jgi:hypothetical protein
MPVFIAPAYYADAPKYYSAPSYYTEVPACYSTKTVEYNTEAIIGKNHDFLLRCESILL